MIETYQDELRPNGPVRGQRDCEERWRLLAPHIPATGVMLDVGSNLGYFGVRAALEHPELAVVSLESDPIVAARQADIVRDHDLTRMMVLLGRLDSVGARAWSDTCDWFDATLLLAILHWMDDPEAVVASLSSMSGKLLCEVPDAADAGACGQRIVREWDDPEQWFSRVTKRRVHHLGRVARHTSDVASHLILIDGPVRRSPRLAYRGGPEQAIGRYEIGCDDRGETTLRIGPDTVDRIPGANLVNLMRAGSLRFPDPDTILRSAAQALAAHPSHPDPFPHNMLWAHDGIHLVDFAPCDALHTRKDGLATLGTHVPRWVRGDTVDDAAAIRDGSLAYRLRSGRLGQAVLRCVPRPIKRRIRRALYGR